jgi:hypothetical protein
MNQSVQGDMFLDKPATDKRQSMGYEFTKDTFLTDARGSQKEQTHHDVDAVL